MLPRQPYAQCEIRTEEMLLSHRRELIGQVTKCCYLLKEIYLGAVYVACSAQEECRNVWNEARNSNCISLVAIHSKIAALSAAVGSYCEFSKEQLPNDGMGF